MAAVAYSVPQNVIIRAQGPASILARAVGRDTTGKLSVILYTAAIVASLFNPWIADAIHVSVAVLWLIPDRWMEHGI